MATYSESRANGLAILTREALKQLPDVCSDFIQAIAFTTQPLTRYVYTGDLKLFCDYLIAEIPRYASKTASELTVDDFEAVTARDLRTYLQYLDFYIKDDQERSNSDYGKMRKLASLRSFYEFMFKNELIHTDVTKLVDMPKIHEKPILRMEIDEAARMLDYVETGETQTERQKSYNKHTRTRDLAILSLFLGSGIRVSELVGLDIEDVDFSINSFMITRKGGNKAILYFSEEVAAPLKAYMALRKEMSPAPGSESALFLSLQNKRMSVRAVEIMVKKYATAAAPLKRRLSPHKLRSTFGTNLYHETGDIYLVADVLGHKDVNTTKRHYAAMTDERRRLAAKKVRLRDDEETD